MLKLTTVLTVLFALAATAQAKVVTLSCGDNLAKGGDADHVIDIDTTNSTATFVWQSPAVLNRNVGVRLSAQIDARWIIVDYRQNMQAVIDRNTSEMFWQSYINGRWEAVGGRFPCRRSGGDILQ